MREILFRGKRKDSGEWVEGGYYCEKIGEYITAAFIAENLTSQVIGHERVVAETVGQFTGLTDRNGNKIFEGDILKQKTTDEFAKVNPFKWERYGVVRFGCYDWNDDYAGNTTMGWYIEHLKSVAIQPKNYCVGCIQHGLNQSDILNEYYPMEVIGNIHDNPELISGDGNAD